MNSIYVKLPEHIGLAISSAAFVTSAYALGHKQDAFLTPYEMQSSNYHEAERKVRLELLYFVADLKVRLSDV